MKTVLILLDTVRLDMLEAYNPDTWVKTPNIKRLAERSVRFDNHYIGSAPCMPARRDLFTGKLNFLERGWGPVEPFDITLPGVLRENGVFTHMITDHHHYFEVGGEGYCQAFNTWDFVRGQGFDRHGSFVNFERDEEQFYGVMNDQYLANRKHFKGKEELYPSSRVFANACDWLNDNYNSDNWMLWLEAFDPHEPFDATKEYTDLYDKGYDGPTYIWQSSIRPENDDKMLPHIVRNYAATLTMVDAWLGKLLDKFDELNMWDDTTIIFTTDHGTMLGEHNWFTKNIMPTYNEIAHIPLLIHFPKDEGTGIVRQEITQNIDVMPTLLEQYDITPSEQLKDRMTGVSLNRSIEQAPFETRDACLYGWYGKQVNMFDGRYTYLRAPAREDNEPCNMYCAIPCGLNLYLGNKVAQDIEFGRFLPYTDYPVYKIPYRTHNIRWDILSDDAKITRLFDLENDPGQMNNIAGGEEERRAKDKMRELLQKNSAPSDQYERLGFTD